MLSKIRRVAQADVLEALERKAMRGEISRRELRMLWLACRPVLGGKTARGRISPPRYDRHNQAMRRALIEANSLALLAQKSPEWLGSRNAYVYRIVHISSEDRLRYPHPAAPDAVVLFADGERDELDLHGIKAGDRIEENALLQGYRPSAACVDYALCRGRAIYSVLCRASGLRKQRALFLAEFLLFLLDVCAFVCVPCWHSKVVQ